MTTPNATPPIPTTQLTFQDDFTSFSASASGSGTTWQDLFPYGGKAAHTLSGNSEAEYYSSSLSGSNSPFSDQNSTLNISAFPAAAGSDPYNLPYTSGVITTAQSFSQTYGYFAVDAKLPTEQGLWPAFWMLPTDGYTAELDDFEVIDNRANTDFATTHGNTNGQWVVDSQALAAPNVSNNFNVFGVDWEPTTTTYYINGQEIGSAPTPQSMSTPMYMLLNLAVGGNGSWPGSPDSSTVFPANMQIAWVQAYSTANTTYVGGSAALSASAASSLTNTSPPASNSTPQNQAAALPTAQPADTSASNPVQEQAAATPTPAAAAPTTGNDTLTVALTEDAYQGDAQASISIDGQTLGSPTVTFLNSASTPEVFTYTGNFGGAAASHDVAISFLNDAYGGPGLDRNLYVDNVSFDGTAAPNAQAALYFNSTTDVFTPSSTTNLIPTQQNS